MKKRLKKSRKDKETAKPETIVIEVKDNMPQLVYGPPSFFRKKAAEISPDPNLPDTEDSTETVPETESIRPEYEKIPAPIYGPPPFLKQNVFTPEDEPVEEVYGPPEVMEPERIETEYEKVPETVYGPPWVFGLDDDSGDGNDQC